MKKVSIFLVFVALVIGATFLMQCGDDKTPCEELADKIQDCVKKACGKYTDCAACKCILDPKAEGCQSSGGTTTTTKCEGDTKTQAEGALKDFKCDTYTGGIDLACKQQ